MIIGAGTVIGATEAVMTYSVENPNATFDQKVKVGVGGAVIGGGSAFATLYAGSSIAAVAMVGAISAGGQQMVKNVVSGNRLDNKVVSQAAGGAVFSAGTTKVLQATKALPTNVGRPIDVNKSRSLPSSLTNNSMNRLTKEIIPNFINSTINVITSSWNAIFGGTVKTRYK